MILPFGNIVTGTENGDSENSTYEDFLKFTECMEK